MIFPDSGRKRLKMTYPTDASYRTKRTKFVGYGPESAIERFGR